VANTRVRGINVWTMAALSFALVAALVAALVFGSHAANAAKAKDLRIDKKVKPKIVQVGQNQTFIIKVKNKSKSNASNVTVTDPLPSKVKFIRASTSLHRPGSCGILSGTVECKLGSLQGGKTVKIKIFVKVVQGGTYINRAFVSQKSREFNATDNIDKVTASATRR
jgi:uncharacterized repeat protein (TIGR01451 family)